MRPLHGERLELMPPHVIVLANKRHRSTRAQPLDEPHGLGSACDPPASRLEAEAGLLVLGVHIPRTEAQLQASLR
jgi:hypothetical protein